MLVFKLRMSTKHRSFRPAAEAGFIQTRRRRPETGAAAVVRLNRSLCAPLRGRSVTSLTSATFAKLCATIDLRRAFSERPFINTVLDLDRSSEGNV
jgi:hypothetical protein